MDPKNDAEQKDFDENSNKLISECGIPIFIHNIVGTCNVGSRISLENIATKITNAEYNPKRFGAVIIRICNPKATALIFASGKIVCAGTKTIADCRTALGKFQRIVCKCCPDVKGNDNFKPETHNMVGVADTKMPIKLEAFSLQNLEVSTYEPELFSGLVYRMSEPKVVILIFVSGNIVITGAKNQTELIDAFNNIYKKLTEYTNHQQLNQ